MSGGGRQYQEGGAVGSEQSQDEGHDRRAGEKGHMGKKWKESNRPEAISASFTQRTLLHNAPTGAPMGGSCRRTGPK